MNYAEKIAQELNLRPFQATAAIELLDDGNTLPFVARYRKEATGSLDEEQLRTLQDRLKQLRALDDRRETILAAIEEQGKLTDELRQRLLAAETATELEDLYQPYKKKRRTRASIAKEKGLQPLADLIIMQLVTRQNEVQIAAPFLTDDVPTAEEALAGARDIVAETISDDAKVRQAVRERALQWGLLQTQKIEDATDERNTYSLYYEFEQQIDRLRPHQVLAINRGETEKVLRVKVEVSERDWLLPVRQHYRPDRRSPLAPQLQLAMDDAAKRLLLPAIERDVRRTLSEQAESHAIAVFGTNLRGLLTQPPLADQVVLAIDPAYRTGCKIAIIDATGKVLDTGTIYPHAPQNKRGEAMVSLGRWVQQHRVTLIAIGNGTASRETEQMVAEFIQQQGGSLHYLMVNEAGASVYSASPLARAELPDLDVTIRGAVSIGRRVQDPLAELVKIDPKSIGVGLYQHDVNQNELSEALAGVVETVVNRVGVDVNTASPALLTHVAGIGPKLAEKIVAHRDENGRFSTRQSLLKVSGLGAKAFEQAAGFLRVRDGDNPLDASAIHPESYGVATAVLQRARLSLDTLPAEREAPLTQFQQKTPLDVLATELKTGVPTLKDIFEQLVRPGRDPREEMPPPILRSDVLAMEDLQVGMVLNGTVRNVVDFGAFVDIGVKQDGLLHRTQIPRRTELNVGDVIEVAILSVDVDRKRISLGWVEG
ncbi:MAG: RNA-binding transcriptional accessory protein [Anaerolineales bacterium]|nr:RNA-binding transcriptional accessory protein [Anaerolineales bacterium]